MGQNWERAALIKARACGGDIAAGEALLKELQPFIWRKYLDYAAVAEIEAMKRQIHAYKVMRRSPSKVTRRATSAFTPEGMIFTASPGRTVPRAMRPAKPRKSRFGRFTHCTGMRNGSSPAPLRRRRSQVEDEVDVGGEDVPGFPARPYNNPRWG